MSDTGVAFPSWRSFRDFQREAARERRYIRTAAATRFLEILARQAHGRVAAIPAGRTFCRAQVAHSDRYEEMIDDELPDAALPDRMKPLADRATEGRVNPRGIPCLYLANNEHTAVAEVRPWIGSLVTLGYFETCRDLRVVDCTRDMSRTRLFLKGEPEAAERNAAVWSDLGYAFREPATRDDSFAEYAATQIVAELFRTEGFDGVAYRSAFGEDGLTIALFDLEAARLVSAGLHEVRDITFAFEQTANPYFVQARDGGGTQLMRTVITSVRAVPPKGDTPPTDDSPTGT